MCAALGFVPWSGWKDFYQVSNDLDIELREQYNIRIGKGALTISRNSPNSAVIRTFGWKSGNFMLYNTRDDKVKTWTWNRYFKNNRCAIAATYWCEFVGEKGNKTAYRFFRKDSNSFALAGIYNPEMNAFSILTCSPSEKLFSDIHDRQPVFLTPEEMDVWLNPDTEEEILLKLLKPPSADFFEVAPMSKLFNSVRSEGKELLDPNFV